MTNNELQAKFKIIFAMITFGTIGILVRNIDLPSTVIALARGIIGTLFLLLIVFAKGQGLDRTAIKRNLLVLGMSGACIGFNWILLFEAYRYTTVATATLAYYMAPIFVMMASPFVLKERLTTIKLLCVAMALTGMVLVSGVVQSGTAGVDFTGILCGVGAASLYATVILLNKFIKNISAYDMTIMQLGLAALVLFPYTMAVENFGVLHPDTTSLLLLAVVGIVHTGFTYALYFSSIQSLKAQTVAIFSYIDPIVAIILSAVLLNESMDIYSIIGAVLVLGSTFVSELAERE
ncbi:MAG: EamA family transporter [Phascolarctobacterium sp.]|nr:EamA family transporter [Phascolarctobacterium sp.]